MAWLPDKMFKFILVLLLLAGCAHEQQNISLEEIASCGKPIDLNQACQNSKLWQSPSRHLRKKRSLILLPPSHFLQQSPLECLP